MGPCETAKIADKLGAKKIETEIIRDDHILTELLRNRFRCSLEVLGCGDTANAGV